MSATTVRLLSASDREQWDALWAGYLAFYGKSLDPGVTEQTWFWVTELRARLFGLGAQEGDILVGFAHCVLHHSTWAIGESCYLEDLFVAPEARGKGVGRALIEAVYAHADALGCERVYWLTHESNVAARGLYDKVAKNLGFIQYRR